MGLTADLISQFVKVTRNTSKTKNETVSYGTIVEKNGVTYVCLDGSDLLTPVSATADTIPGERVTVMIKNHRAVVTGNISSPAARVADVNLLGEGIIDLDNTKVNNVTFDELVTAHNNLVELTDDNFNVLQEQIQAIPNASSTILETGVSGIWSYVKWASGKIDLWASYLPGTLNCVVVFGAMYRTSTITPPAFPFNVLNPILVSSYESSGNGAMLFATTTATNTNPPSYYLLSPTSVTLSNGAIKFHVHGEWE